MSTWNALGASGRAVISVLGVAVVGGVGYLVWQGNAPPAAVTEPQPVAANVATDGAVAEAPVAAAPAAAPDATPEAVATVTPPSFDNWRVEADGSAVVSGRAAAGAMIAVLVDGVTVTEADAASGEFAALFTLPANDKPSLMTLQAKMPDGTVIASEQTIALEPIKGPFVAVAEPVAEPAAEPVAEVVAEAAPAAVMVTEDGASVVQPSAAVDPAVLANVTVDAITYTPTGAVQLGGSGMAGQFVRVYLDNAPLVTALVPDGGRWLSTLPEVAAGIYTLRVDQIDDAGTVTSRFETPFKRETTEALAAAAAPAADTAAVAPQDPAPVETATAAPAPAEPAAAQPAAPEPAPAVAVVAEAPATAPTPEPEAAPADVAATDAAPAATQVASNTGTSDPSPADAAPAAKAPVTITVQPGFTLWQIARENFGNGVMYVQVFEANKDKIRDPNLIYPGQVFTVPVGE